MGLSARRRIVLIGPHGAGKTSLAKALADRSGDDCLFEIERIVTDRPRRPGEDDREYEFVTSEQFAAQRASYLYVQPNRGVAWSYALRQDRPLADGVVRIYVVIPETAEFLKQQFPDQTAVIGILPSSTGILRQRLLARDPAMTDDELGVRLAHIDYDVSKVHELADTVFYNSNDLPTATSELRHSIAMLVQE